jgi:hypothetical protein
VILYGAAALARARSLAIPVASCVAAGIGTGHLTDDLSRDELLALVAVLAEAADPVAVRDSAQGRHPVTEERAALLRAARAQGEACRKAGRERPPHVAALEREYWRNRKAAQADAREREAAREAAEARALAEQEAHARMILAPARELEPCPSLAAYRRHKAAGEPFEECGCGEAARTVWRARKRVGGKDAAREKADAA